MAEQDNMVDLIAPTLVPTKVILAVWHALPLYLHLCNAAVPEFQASGRCEVFRTSRELAVDLNVSSGSVEKWKKKLQEEGLLLYRQSGHRTRFRLPRLEESLKEHEDAECKMQSYVKEAGFEFLEKITQRRPA